MNISIKLARTSYIMFLYYCCLVSITTTPMTPTTTTTSAATPLSVTPRRKNITPTRSEKANVLLPMQTLKYFRHYDENDRDRLIKLLASSLIFSKQKTEIIVGENGNVHYLHREKIPNQYPKTKDIQSPPEKKVLFSHRFVTHSPMLIAGEDKKGKPFIISAGNYYNTNYKQWVSEIIMFKNKSQSYTVKQLNEPIQSIKLSENENLLIVALRSTILLYNLNESKITDGTIFEPDKINIDQKQIINMAICPDNSFIAIIGKNGIMEMMNIIQDTLFSLQKITIPKDTKAIHYPTNNTILYLTDNN